VASAETAAAIEGDDNQVTLTGNLTATDSEGEDLTFGVEGVDPDANGDTLVQGQFGTLTVHADGSYEYAPNDSLPAGHAGQEQFTFTVADPSGASDSAALRINVTGTNDGPVAQAEVVTAP
jgi:VCBS repeat-containing protein